MTHPRAVVVALALAAVPAAATADTAIEKVLDALHQAASNADAERYFGLFAPDAVFFGTDPEERWTLDEFRDYTEARFSAGDGWTYEVVERHVVVAPDGRVAWFDEALDNERYGRCRGTGVLVLGDGGWKIAQYNLSIPIPNDLALTVVDLIRDHR